MKKYLLLICVPLLLLQACGKKDNIVYPHTVSDKYQLNNVHDYYISFGVQHTIVKFALNDELKDGQKFTITPIGLPADVEVSPSYAETSNADTVIFYFATNYTSAASHPITFKTEALNRPTKTATLNFISQPSCAATLYGNWNVYDSGWTTTFVPSHYVAFVTNDGDKINLELTNRIITCNLDCHAGTFTSEPFFNLLSGSEGTGKFTNNRIEATYAIYSGGNTYMMTSIFTR